MKKICVFCGSSPGGDPGFMKAAVILGQILAKKQIELIYGGASVGMMGAIADTVLQTGGKVTGVIPKFLKDKEVAHTHLTDLVVVDSMHARKMKMADLSDGFIALPGGLGTIEEFFEVVNWAQLGMHRKPCGLLNVSGYFDKLDEFLSHAVSERLIREEHRSMILMDPDPESLLVKFESYHPPVVEKWLDRKA